ncbi:Hypothetical predicted protein [Mytilus galloprovincialis]|uniref:Uncharacterized protein n=1 Tax=Mytilus galloprovincialis TaxID=29158 RepID=A0A8B6D4I4_MYTGA|nr:Hypothetical predicted protein [Mytilus galloprovincialis]
MARKQQDENLQTDKFDYMDLSDTFIADIEGPGNSEKAIIKPPSVNKNVIMPWPDVNSHSLDRKNLSEEQHKDPEKRHLRDAEDSIIISQTKICHNDNAMAKKLNMLTQRIQNNA